MEEGVREIERHLTRARLLWILAGASLCVALALALGSLLLASAVPVALAGVFSWLATRERALAEVKYRVWLEEVRERLARVTRTVE